MATVTFTRLVCNQANQVVRALRLHFSEIPYDPATQSAPPIWGPAPMTTPSIDILVPSGIPGTILPSQIEISPQNFAGSQAVVTLFLSDNFLEPLFDGDTPSWLMKETAIRPASAPPIEFAFPDGIFSLTYALNYTLV